MAADLDLPRGPLVQHLRSAHRIIETLGAAIERLGGGRYPDPLVEAHRHHMEQVGAYTADRPRAGGPTVPRPDPLQPGEHQRDGWDLLIAGPDGTILAGWDAEERFWAWSPTEVIVRTCVDALRDTFHTTEENPRG